jgi:hypothetical protein
MAGGAIQPSVGVGTVVAAIAAEAGRALSSVAAHLGLCRRAVQEGCVLAVPLSHKCAHQ